LIRTKVIPKVSSITYTQLYNNNIITSYMIVRASMGRGGAAGTHKCAREGRGVVLPAQDFIPLMWNLAQIFAQMLLNIALRRRWRRDTLLLRSLLCRATAVYIVYGRNKIPPTSRRWLFIIIIIKKKRTTWLLRNNMQ